MEETCTFEQLTISRSLIERLKNSNITTPTPVQQQVIPHILNNENVLFQSETGTGKTLAYLLPLIQLFADSHIQDKKSKILVIAPTYELSSQIKSVIQSITDTKCTLCIGGTQIKRQVEALKEKPFIIVGNPARIVELIRLKKIKTESIKAVVLDEIDRLTSKEISHETATLLQLLPANKQTIGCSATVSKQTKQFIEKIINTTPQVIELPLEDVLKHRITHMAFYAERRDKIDTLRQILNAIQPKKAIIFTSRQDQVINITSKLQYKKILCEGLFAKADKKDRKTVIDHFKSGVCPILVTSDLASRGLDIPGITHIIQMDLPADADFFIHRAGRTARANTTGINIVIGDEYELQHFAQIEKKLGIIVYPKQLYKGKIVAPLD
ncbi:MAG: DEAD/DEAH box helicase [Treponema sp.]|nr:DEAD/DEAH box helicase [Treponema sp.]